MKARSSINLPVHNNSRTIAKQKPKIRIIHIVAPEIIKTDVQNFRNLVQELTGKQGSTIKKVGKKSVPSILPPILLPKACRSNHPTNSLQYNSNDASMIMKKERIEEVHDGRGISNPGFLSFLNLGDVDGFIHGLNEFPVRSSQMNTFGERPHLC